MRMTTATATTVDDGSYEPRPILNLTDITLANGERGMLSAALDPDFDEFPFLYIYYTAQAEPEPQITGQLSRFPVVDGAAIRADELVIMTLSTPNVTHLGGAIRFGPDGMLYLGLGDNTDSRNSQNLASHYGKIIRIDVRGASAEQPYRIPDDNPFADDPQAQPEIWAYGLRNPWRMDFDADGNLWVADVGTAVQEEVSIASAGANLGWPLFEGTICRAAAAQCAALSSATTPAVTYSRKEGCGIIGEIASPQPDLRYIFADYCTRRIWALERDDTTDTGWRRREIAQADNRILAFGTDAAGQVFVLMQQSPIRRLVWKPSYLTFPLPQQKGRSEGIGSVSFQVVAGVDVDSNFRRNDRKLNPLTGEPTEGVPQPANVVYSRRATVPPLFIQHTNPYQNEPLPAEVQLWQQALTS